MDQYIETTLRAVSTYFPFIIKSYAEMIRRREYDGGFSAKMTTYKAAMDNTVKSSDNNGVDSTLPACIAASMAKAIEVGFEEDDMVTVFEMYLNKDARKEKK